MDSEDAQALEPVHALIEAFAARLPAGARGDDVRRALTRMHAALVEDDGIEEAVREVVAALHRLDEDTVGGRRREFQRNAPAVGLLLETLQEQLLPVLRRAGHRV